jgi:hypothetical protein
MNCFSFERRASSELSTIQKYMTDRLAELGKPAEVDVEDLAIFVKYCRNLAMERYRSIEEELKADETFKEHIRKFGDYSSRFNKL